MKATGFTRNMKRQAVLDYVKEHEPADQSDISRHFLEEFGYKNIESARQSISRILNSLEQANYIQKRTEPNESSGSIDKNVWSTASS